MQAFLSPSLTARAEILSEVEKLSGCYAGAALHLNKLMRIILSMTSDDLAQFANDIGPEMVDLISELHKMHGDSVSELSRSAADFLHLSGKPTAVSGVDTRPLETKLAEQFRAITFDGTSFGVIDLPQPEPQPEPENATPSDDL